MSMNVGSSGGENEVMVEMNTTPLIDVMLVLLIMLIITIPVQTHAVKIDMPLHSTPPTTQPEIVNLQLDFDGTLYWNGVGVTDRDQMDQMMQEAADKPVQPEIRLLPNKLVKYRYVAQILADAQRLGLTKIGVVGNEQYVGGS
jgi:biopolymer transport protein ExbD